VASRSGPALRAAADALVRSCPDSAADACRAPPGGMQLVAKWVTPSRARDKQVTRIERGSRADLMRYPVLPARSDTLHRMVAPIIFG